MYVCIYIYIYIYTYIFTLFYYSVVYYSISYYIVSYYVMLSYRRIVADKLAAPSRHMTLCSRGSTKSTNATHQIRRMVRQVMFFSAPFITRQPHAKQSSPPAYHAIPTQSCLCEERQQQINHRSIIITHLNATLSDAVCVFTQSTCVQSPWDDSCAPHIVINTRSVSSKAREASGIPNDFKDIGLSNSCWLTLPGNGVLQKAYHLDHSLQYLPIGLGLPRKCRGKEDLG